MKILVYGDASPASGGWCYAEALRDMGHDVLQVRETEKLEHYKSSLLHRVCRKVLGNVLERDRRRHVQGLMGATRRFRPAVVIIQKGLQISREDVVAIKQGGAWVCNVNHDDFFSKNRNNWTWIQRRAICAYDYIFTTREVNVDEIKAFNSHVEFFPFAYYPRIHRPVVVPPSESNRWKSDVVFVGTYEHERAGLLEEFVRRTDFSLSIHGAQWDRLPPHSRLKQRLGCADLRFDDLSKAIGAAGVALGFLRKENRDDYTQRTFEIPACRGLLLAERTKRHLQLFGEGKEAEFFDASSPTELISKVALLVRDVEKSNQIRDAGYKAVVAGRHTYQDRLTRLLQVREMVVGRA